MKKGDVIEFVARYPAEHKHAGAIIGRKAKCPACGGEFKQFQINPKWLDAMRPGARASYILACEVRRGGVAFQPTHCPHCDRSVVTVPRPVDKRSG